MKPQSYRQRLHQFATSYVVMDLRAPSETRLARATAYERRYKTFGNPSRYRIGAAPERIAESPLVFPEPALSALHKWIVETMGWLNVPD